MYLSAFDHTKENPMKMIIWIGVMALLADARTVSGPYLVELDAPILAAGVLAVGE